MRKIRIVPLTLLLFACLSPTVPAQLQLGRPLQPLMPVDAPSPLSVKEIDQARPQAMPELQRAMQDLQRIVQRARDENYPLNRELHNTVQSLQRALAAAQQAQAQTVRGHVAI
jgi:hypothetical protein